MSRLRFVIAAAAAALMIALPLSMAAADLPHWVASTGVSTPRINLPPALQPTPEPARVADSFAMVENAMAQAPAAPPLATAPLPLSNTAVDLTSLVLLAVHLGMLGVLAGAYFLVNKYVKDEAARKVVFTAIASGVGYGMNKTQGALAGKVLSVNVGSQVAATALSYVKDAVPAAVGRFGLTDAALAKMIFARLPSVDGPVPDETITTIVKASGGGTVPPPSAGDLITILLPEIEAVVARALDKNRAPPQPPKAA